MDLLGAHVSVAGGPHTAFERGAKIGCRSLQIFVKSPNRWKGGKLTDEQIDKFAEARLASPQPVIAHAAYLINLCGSDSELLEKSRKGLLDELRRCTHLSVDALVVHPGAHLGEGEESGVDGIARSVDLILAELGESPTRLLLENTAGQGSALGFRFEQLGAMIDRMESRERVGVCLDTCHAFSAGYDLRTNEGYETMLAAADESFGLARIEAVHLNDSKHPLGSRKDRHENIGQGQIGVDAFARIISDERLAGRPLVLETPLGDDDDGHRRDLERLRSLQ